MAAEARKWDYISCYFRERTDAPVTPAIDDRTWNDLDMDDVFLKLDRTRSSVGQAGLYDMMRRPLFDETERAARRGRILGLAHQPAQCLSLRRALARLGVQKTGEIFQFLSSRRAGIQDRRRYLYMALSAIAVLSIAAPFLLGLPGLLLIAASAVTNLVIHYKFKATVAVESPSYEYLHRVLAAGMRLSRLPIPLLSPELQALRELSATLGKLRRRTALLITPTGFSGDIISMFLEYIRQFFLQEVTTYFFVHNEIIRRMDDISRVYGLVGAVDALQAAAAMRQDLSGITTPEYSETFEAEDLAHPLLKKPVPNSLKLERTGVVVTGSNMSGKSTFLRTMGVNQILSGTLCMAFARRMRSPAFFTVTSITNRDNILASESHYLVEARRLLDILGAARGTQTALVIIDEILSGTNSEERIAASVSILRYLAGLNCRVLAATHDRPIAADLEGIYSNVHFTHRVEEEGLQFDYTLHDGIVEAGNAIRLLRLLGYPTEVLEDLA
jgi:DNA mismatch repair ATPase MutS